MDRSSPTANFDAVRGQKSTFLASLPPAFAVRFPVLGQPPACCEISGIVHLTCPVKACVEERTRSPSLDPEGRTTAGNFGELRLSPEYVQRTREMRGDAYVVIGQDHVVAAVSCQQTRRQQVLLGPIAVRIKPLQPPGLVIEGQEDVVDVNEHARPKSWKNLKEKDSHIRIHETTVRPVHEQDVSRS